MEGGDLTTIPFIISGFDNFQMAVLYKISSSLNRQLRVQS